MRAVTIDGGEIVVAEVPDPRPGPGQLLIAPHAAGICGSDLHLREMLGEMAAISPDPLPSIIPGHEFAGEVVAIGPDTETELSAGDLVAVNPFTHGPDGPATIGLSPLHGGGLAELTVADATRTVRLAPGLDGRLGALCEPVAVSVRAVGRAAPDGPIVVVGAGPIGLGIVAVAALEGRHPIVVVEPSARRRDLAAELGADVAIEPGSAMIDVLAAVGFSASPPSPLLDGAPSVATVFECVGRSDVIQQLVADAPPHSRVVLAGACMHAVEIQPVQLTMNEVTLDTTYAYRPHDFERAAALLGEHPERFGGLITSERPLGATVTAFGDLAERADEIKILIDPRR